ncbi:MAG: DNA-binding response regulator [Acidobacteria bacterium]|nr:MAG: DNA-binding response regulator [Acidobacteriota bacterium]
MRILVVEDEKKVARALQQGLEARNYEVTLAYTGEEGFFLVNAQTFDLLILDLMLPGRNGLEILATLRRQRLQTPVLILTARDALDDRVRGLGRGRPDQVLHLKVGDLEMDLVTRRVTRKGQTIELSAREYDLLEYLLRYRGQVVSKEMLARDVWKEPTRATPLDNLIEVHIARLRRKIDDPFSSKLLKTVRGVGYILKEDNA